jgi:hypothetical protein
MDNSSSDERDVEDNTENVASGGENSPPPQPSTSLADCFTLDPILDNTMRQLLDEEKERRRRQLV